MVISPDLAAKLLKHNRNNRNVRPALVRQYAEDMRQGHFDITHQGIAFYQNGDLADGQHRLMAVVESGVSVVMVVTVGMAPSSHIDMGTKRTEVDSIRIANNNMSWATNRAVAMVNILKTTFPGVGIVTLNDKEAYLMKHQTAVQFALDTYRSSTKSLCSSAIPLAFMIAYQNGVSADVLSRAAGILSTGMMTGQKDPAFNTMMALRNYLVKYGGRSGSGYNKLVLYATAHMLSRYASGQPLTRVVIPVKFPFSVYDVNGAPLSV